MVLTSSPVTAVLIHPAVHFRVSLYTQILTIRELLIQGAKLSFQLGLPALSQPGSISVGGRAKEV